MVSALRPALINLAGLARDDGPARRRPKEEPPPLASPPAETMRPANSPTGRSLKFNHRAAADEMRNNFSAARRFRSDSELGTRHLEPATIRRQQLLAGAAAGRRTNHGNEVRSCPSRPIIIKTIPQVAAGLHSTAG